MSTAVEQLREEQSEQEFEGGQAVTRAEVDAAAADLENVVDGEVFEDDEGQFVISVGGKKPTTKKIRLYAGGFECPEPEGGWVKGREYAIRVEVRCHKQSYSDQKDGKTGSVVGCREEFGLTITGAALAK